ncbi:MAG: ABC transporter substrate-binding protein [Anaerolineae bacterium]|nr:ABC transporter substrate-binding protein [Anaerolineae bacterium]
MPEIHGVYVPFEIPPRRAVSLVPGLTLSLFELDLGGRLVGRTTYCTEPAGQVARVPTVGAPHAPDIERIEALRPDVVLGDEDNTPDEAAAALAAGGVTPWIFAPRTVKQATDILWAIMHAFDEAKMVPRVRAIEQTADYLLLVIGHPDYRPARAFVPLRRRPWMTVNRDTYTSDLLRLCGATNVFAMLGDRYSLIAEEEIIEAQPEVVLLPFNEPYAFDGADVAYFESLDIPAARQGRVHLVDGRQLIWYGTETSRALAELPRLLMPPDRPH